MQLPALQTLRLDAIERALDQMAGDRYGACARCGNLVDVDRLRKHPDSHVCEKCALAAPPDLA